MGNIVGKIKDFELNIRKIKCRRKLVIRFKFSVEWLRYKNDERIEYMEDIFKRLNLYKIEIWEREKNS